MPDGKEEDIPLGLDEDLGEEAPSDRALEGSPFPKDLHYVINTYTDPAMEDPYPPMMSPDEVMKADWFVSFKSDQDSPAGLHLWLESHIAGSKGSWVQNQGTNGGSFVGASSAETYYSGIVYNTDFMFEPAGRTFFHHLWLAINGPWFGKDGRNFSPTAMDNLATTLEDLVTMVRDAEDKVEEWRTTAEDTLKGATADVFVQHLRNLQLRFNDLGNQAETYPDPLRDTRDKVVITAGQNIRNLYNDWLATDLWDPYKVIKKWFDDNYDIATINKGDDSSQIGDIGKANNPNTWKEIQERIKQDWRNRLNELIAGAAESMQTIANAYTDNIEKFAEVKADPTLTLDWSPVGGGGGPGPGPGRDGGGGDDGKSEAQKEYEKTLDEWYEEQTRWLKENPPGGGEGDRGGDGGDGPSNEDRYNQAVNDYYQRMIDELEGGPESGGGDLRGNGGDGGDGSGPSSEDRYNQAVNDYYQRMIDELEGGPESGGGDLRGNGGDGGDGSGSSSEDRYNRAVNDYYNRQADELEREMDAPPPPVGGGGQLGGGGSGGSGNRNRSSEDRYNRAVDDYYEQAIDDLDEQMNGGPDSGGGDLGGGGEDSQPSAEEYEQRLQEYYEAEKANLEQRSQELGDLIAGPESGGGDLGGSDAADARRDQLEEYYDQQRTALEEQMNAGPQAGGGGLGDSLGRDNGSGAGEEHSYSIGNGWEAPVAEDQLLAPSASGAQPDANGVQAGGGDLRGNSGSGGGEAFTGAVSGNGGGNFGGLGPGTGMGGMPPMMPPMGGMGGMGGAGGQNDNSRTRSTWLSEDERVWGTSEGDRLSVLGRPAPGDNTKGSPHEYVFGADGAGTRTSEGGPGEGRPGKRKPGIGNRRGRLQGQGDQREG